MAAWIAAALTRLARSAPHSPGVDRAISSASTFYWQSKARTAPRRPHETHAGVGTHMHGSVSILAHNECTRAVLTGGKRCVFAAAVGERRCDAMQCNAMQWPEGDRSVYGGRGGVVAVPGARARWTDRARGSACGRAHPVRQSEPARMALQLSTMHCNGWLADVNSFRSMRQVPPSSQASFHSSAHTATRTSNQRSRWGQLRTDAAHRVGHAHDRAVPCERHDTARIPACRSGRAAQEPCPAPAVLPRVAPPEGPHTKPSVSGCA